LRASRLSIVENRNSHFSFSLEERLTIAQLDLQKWTAAEFAERVLAAQPRVAVFDCDGTLWSGDAGYGFMAWTIEQGLVSRSTSDWIDTRHRAYLAGSVSELAICGEMVQMYAGLHEDELRAAAARYVEEFVLQHVFAEMASLIAALREKGVELWAVSSTNKWVIAEGVRPFGIPENKILAAEVAVDAGIITSRIVDVPTDEGKASSLRRSGLNNPDAVFGNSVHDLAMLEIARNPFPVNPSPALLAAVAANGWGYFRPAAAEGIEAAVAGE
jgi:phosphoserine phosphatase